MWLYLKPESQTLFRTVKRVPTLPRLRVRVIVYFFRIKVCSHVVISLYITYIPALFFTNSSKFTNLPPNISRELNSRIVIHQAKHYWETLTFHKSNQRVLRIVVPQAQYLQCLRIFQREEHISNLLRTLTFRTTSVSRGYSDPFAQFYAFVMRDVKIVHQNEAH